MPNLNSKLPILPLTLAEIGFLLFFLLVMTVIVKQVIVEETNPEVKACREIIGKMPKAIREEAIERGQAAVQEGITTADIRKFGSIERPPDQNFSSILEECENMPKNFPEAMNAIRRSHPNNRDKSYAELMEQQKDIANAIQEHQIDPESVPAIMRNAGDPEASTKMQEAIDKYRQASPENIGKTDEQLAEELGNIAEGLEQNNISPEELPERLASCPLPGSLPPGEAEARSNARTADELRSAGRGDESPSEIAKEAGKISESAKQHGIPLEDIPQSLCKAPEALKEAIQAWRNARPENAGKTNGEIGEEIKNAADAAKRNRTPTKDIPDILDEMGPADAEEREENERTAEALRRAGDGSESSGEIADAAEAISRQARESSIRLQDIPAYLQDKMDAIMEAIQQAIQHAKGASQEDFSKSDGEIADDIVDIAKAAEAHQIPMDDIPKTIANAARETSDQNLADILRGIGEGDETPEELVEKTQAIAEMAKQRNIKLGDIPKAIGDGIDKPACWWKNKDRREVAYLFDIIINEEDVEFRKNESAWRKNGRPMEAENIPGIKEILSLNGEPTKLTRAIHGYLRSINRYGLETGTEEQRPACVFHVILRDNAVSKGGYKNKRLALERYFYKHEPSDEANRKP